MLRSSSTSNSLGAAKLVLDLTMRTDLIGRPFRSQGCGTNNGSVLPRHPADQSRAHRHNTAELRARDPELPRRDVSRFWPPRRPYDAGRPKPGGTTRLGRTP